MTDLAAALADLGIAIRSHRPGEHRTACPRCAFERRRPHDTALAVKLDERGATFHCHRCAWTGAVSDRATTDRPRHRSAAPPPPADPPALRWSPRAEEMWAAGRPIFGSPVQRYLAGRGCGLPPAGEEVIRHLPDAFHWRSRTRWSAMMALITDAVTGERMSIHLTFLAVDDSGKAPVDRPKLLLPGHQKAGGVIRLTEDGETTFGLGIAEGIETALAVAATGWLPTWSTVDAGNLRSFPVLNGVEALTIFADADAAGLTAAEAAAQRWRSAGREAKVYKAPAVRVAA